MQEWAGARVCPENPLIDPEPDPPMSLRLATLLAVSLLAGPASAAPQKQNELADQIGKAIQLPQGGKWVGREVELTEGNTYVAVFWGGQWCPPCVRILGVVGELAEALSAKPIVFYGIGGESPENLQKVLERYPELDLPTASLERGKDFEILKPLGIGEIPTFVVHDAAGTILALGDGREANKFAPAPTIPPDGQAPLPALHAFLMAADQIDPALMEKAKPLLADLRTIRKVGDPELEAEVLAELAALGKPFLSYGVQRVELLHANKERQEECWTYGLSLLAEHGHHGELVRFLVERIAIARNSDGQVALKQLEQIIELGPEFHYVGLDAFRYRQRLNSKDTGEYGRALVKRLQADGPRLLGLAKAAAGDAELARSAADAACTAFENKHLDALLLSGKLAFEAKDYAAATSRLELAVELAEAGQREAIQSTLDYYRLAARRDKSGSGSR